jgi:hypothetical protein
MALCLDGKWHKLSEFYDILETLVPPEVATRAFASVHKYKDGNMLPLPIRVQKGRERVIRSAIRQLFDRGYVETNIPDGNPDGFPRIRDFMKDFRLRLTPEGLAHIRNMGRGGAGGPVWGIIGRLFGQGKISVTVARVLAPESPFEEGGDDPPAVADNEESKDYPIWTEELFPAVVDTYNVGSPRGLPKRT